MVGWVFHRLGIWNGVGFTLGQAGDDTLSTCPRLCDPQSLDSPTANLVPASDSSSRPMPAPKRPWLLDPPIARQSPFRGLVARRCCEVLVQNVKSSSHSRW
jgi:hypothetical protein